MSDKKIDFKNLSPKQKRLFAIAGTIGVVVVLAFSTDWLFSPKGDTKAKRQDVERHVLTNADTRKLGIDGLSAAVSRMRREIQDLSATVNRNQQEGEREQKNRSAALEKELTDLKKELHEYKIKNENDLSKMRTAKISEAREKVGGSSSTKTKTGSATPVRGNDRASERAEKAESGRSERAERQRERREARRERQSRTSAGLNDPREIFTQELPTSMLPEEIHRPQIVINENGEEEIEEEEPLLTTHVINAAPKEKEKKEKARKIAESKAPKESEIEFYMPTGSIISAMLLNGIDASTSSGAKQEPMPALLRVEKNAILPNRFSSDIKDCFVLVSGHGDLSSERAYLRGEYLSCVRNDGAVLETKFPSYVVGEDGKAGMKGRLVSKQGQMIARSLVAGFAFGVSKAFDVTPVSVLDTSSIGGSVQYQNNFNSGLMRGAAAQGASQALEKVADFYIKMAEQIFPVVEITAGRQVNLIVSNGTKLRLKNMNELSDANTSTPTAVSNNSVITQSQIAQARGER